MKIIIPLIFSLFLFACSTSEEVQKNDDNENGNNVYVFDEITAKQDSNLVQKLNETKDTTDVNVQNLNKEFREKNVKYFVQVGAFTTKARAERFMKVNEDKITFPMKISYSEKVKLYVVRLPYFKTREAAEKVRNALWETKEFKDAFIVTVIE